MTTGFKSQYSEFSMVVESFLQLPLNGRKCWRRFKREIGAQQMLLQALRGVPLPWANPGLGMERAQEKGVHWKSTGQSLTAGSVSPPGCTGDPQSGGVVQQLLQQCR